MKRNECQYLKTWKEKKHIEWEWGSEPLVCTVYMYSIYCMCMWTYILYRIIVNRVFLRFQFPLPDTRWRSCTTNRSSSGFPETDHFSWAPQKYHRHSTKIKMNNGEQASVCSCQNVQVLYSISEWNYKCLDAGLFFAVKILCRTLVYFFLNLIQF